MKTLRVIEWSAKAVLHFTESLFNLVFGQFQGDEWESRRYILRPNAVTSVLIDCAEFNAKPDSQIFNLRSQICVQSNQGGAICNNTFSFSRYYLNKNESVCHGAERIVKIDIM